MAILVYIDTILCWVMHEHKIDFIKVLVVIYQANQYMYISNLYN